VKGQKQIVFKRGLWQGTHSRSESSTTFLNVGGGGELHVARVCAIVAQYQIRITAVVVTVSALSSPVDLFVGCFFKLELMFPLPTDFEDSFLPPSG
jgi:hypothetical protein